MTRAEVEQLYTRYAPAVLRRARSILGDAAMAQDAMHDVFAVLVREEDRFRGQSSVLTWLYQATTHRCLNLLRDRTTRERLLAEQVPSERASPGPEDLSYVRELLLEVPEALREIAIYYYVDQMDQEEIAALLGVSRRTVGNRLEEFKTAARAAGGAT